MGHAQTLTNRPPTRAEIIRGGDGPMRTCYHVVSYHLDVRIDPQTQSIKGSNKITFQTLSDFEMMQVDLFTNLAVGRILLDDKSVATVTREYGAMFIHLPETMVKGSTHSVTIEYGGHPIVAQRPPWSGGFTWEHDDAGNPWVVVTCQGTGASLWWPNKDQQTDRPDNVTISVTVPPGLEDVSNGRLQARTVQPDGWVRYDWFVSYPINNYCVTFNIGKFAHFSDEYDHEGRKLTLDYYVLPKNLEKAKKQFAQVKDMLDTYEKDFGPYPFYRDGFKLIDCPHTGMEHQSAVAYGNHYVGGYRGRSSSAVGLKFDFIIIHECAHEWWGNNICSKDVADMWIHESFGAYAESLFVEDHYGRAAALKYINGKKPNVRNDRPIIGDYGLNREGSGDMYDKGQLVLNTLRSALDNDTLWFSILRGLNTDFAHQTVTAEDFFNYFSKKSGQNLTPLFDQYFHHATLPRLMVESQKEGDNVTARYRWQADVDGFQMPIKVLTAPGKYETIHPTAEWQTITLHGLNPEDFKVADDLFYCDVHLRYSYLDPRRNSTR